jgi:hypothetical protein
MKTLVSLLFLIPVALDTYAFEPLFDTRIDYPLSDPASHLVSGDFNMDGYLDLAVAPYYKDSISILLGTWDGTFQAPLKYGTLDSILSLFASDFDNDADLDLAVIHRLGGKVSVMKNLGDGSFLFDSSYTAGTRLSSIWCADINNDSYNDIIVADVSSGAISILLNTDSFKFLPRRSYNILPGAISVVADDFDNDGSMDIAGAAGSGDFQSFWVILMNNGQGQFRDTLQFYNSLGFSSIRAGDLNQDGRSDIAVLSDSLKIYINHGGDRFSLAQTLPSGAAARAISICDLNENGDNDLAVVDPVGSKVYTYFNNGNAGFTIHDSLPTSSGPRWISSGDFNSDGIFDLVVANTSGQCVSIYKNNAYGDFPMPRLYDLPVNPMKITCTNLDGNEYDDLLIETDTDSVVAMINDGNFQFTRTASIRKNGTLLKGNFNHDNLDDIAILHYYYPDSAAFSIFISNGNGVFGNEFRFTVPYVSSLVICVSDLNGDGISDFVFRGSSDSLSIALSNQDGIYVLQPRLYIPYQFIDLLMAADLDSDGDNDLVVGYDSITILQNNGVGAFEPIQTFELPNYYYRQVFGFDIDGDSDKDLVIFNGTYHQIYILRNMGNMNFQEAGTYSIPGIAEPAIAADINADGKIDIVSQSVDHLSVSPIINLGNGLFERTVGYGTAYYQGFTAGDINGDGIADLITNNYSSYNGYPNKIAIMINNSMAQNTSENQNLDLPKYFSISQNYPNPFNAQTTIHYTLPNASEFSIDIFDITGRKIETILSGHQEAGEHEAIWNAAGKASGIYFYRLKTGEYSRMVKCVLLK